MCFNHPGIKFVPAFWGLKEKSSELLSRGHHCITDHLMPLIGQERLRKVQK